MHTLYSMRRSGNCYKVRLALAQLDVPYELVEIDILKGETRTPEFLKMNPIRPRAAARSVAGPLYRRVERDTLVSRRPYAAVSGRPRRPRRDAAMDVLRAAQPGAQSRRRLFLADAGEGRPRPAKPRAGRLDARGLPRARRHGEAPRQRGGSSPPTRYSIADIALYGYTHVAHTCDYDLAGFPAVRAWLDRIAAQPGHIAMDWEPHAMPRRSSYSPALMLASLITFAHLAMSALMMAARASGGSATASRPSCASLAFISGSIAILAACE